MVARVIQKEDLDPTDFSNNNLAKVGGVKIKTNAGSAVGDAIPKVVGSSVTTTTLPAGNPQHQIREWIAGSAPSTLTVSNNGTGWLVNPPNTSALSEAELIHANASKSSVSVDSMTHVLGNSANTGTINSVIGTRDVDGGMGTRIRLTASLDESVGVNETNFKNSNGGFFSLSSVTTVGTVLEIPDGPYPGYHVYIGGAQIANIGNYGEIIIKFKAGVTGTVRRTDHSIGYMPAGDTDIIVRGHEYLHLMWSGTAWRVLAYQPRMFFGDTWYETHHGRVAISFTFSEGTTIPPGNMLAYDVPLPIKMSGNGYQVTITGRNASATMPLGLSVNTNAASLIFDFFRLSSDATTMRIGAENVGPDNSSVGTTQYSVLGAPDYADLGGIASY